MTTKIDLTEQMQTHIQTWEANQDDRAIFLKCYAMMTGNMLKAVEGGEFEDCLWVNKLTYRFAGYYFDALTLYEDDSDETPPVWTFTFETARSRQAHVLQNLLLGVNAHICYDLIFALADSIRDEWPSLTEDGRTRRYRDHCHVNQIIGATLDDVQDDVVEQYSALMNIVDVAFGRLDEWMIHALIKRWREQVWGQAVNYVTAPPEAKAVLMDEYTRRADERARAIQGQRGVRGIVDLF